MLFGPSDEKLRMRSRVCLTMIKLNLLIGMSMAKKNKKPKVS